MNFDGHMFQVILDNEARCIIAWLADLCVRMLEEDPENVSMRQLAQCVPLGQCRLINAQMTSI